MISQLIDYLIHQPSDSTSPMAVALGAGALLSELGDTVTAISLIDTRDTEGDPPYCKFWDTGEIEQFSPPADYVVGAARSYMEKEFMHVECAAYGPTVTIASSRAEYLQQAVRGKLQSLIGGVQSAGLAARNDLAGSNSVDVIKRIIIKGSRPAPPPMGPGTFEQVQWTVSRVFRVEVWVGHSMAAPA